MEQRNIVDIFLRNAQKQPWNVIVKYRPGQDAPFEDLTWKELEGQVKAFAAAMIDLGLQPGDRVAILSFNRVEWMVADLGTMLAGGVVVPIYHTNTAEQCAYIIKDSGAKFVVVEDSVQLYKVRLQWADLFDLQDVILIHGQPPRDSDRVLSYRTIMEDGEASLPSRIPDMAARLKAVKADDLATIVYTSGTTGPPKGCLVSHGNTTFVLESIDRLIRIDPAKNLSLLVLPLSHFYPRVSGYYYNIYKAAPLAICQSIDQLAADMAEIKPTFFCSVPRIFEKLHARISGAAREGSFFKRLLFNWAVNIGRAKSRSINSGQPLSPLLRSQAAIADRLVFGKVRERLGGRLEFAVSAGAPLSAEIGEFIHALGVQVIEFYGLTETLGGTMTTFEQCRYGTVGKPMPGFEVELAEDGEILIRGNNFQGYHNRPDLTKEVLIDGWCHTGDVGKWDSDGFLVVTDRKKDLIITSGGKNVGPQNIENDLKGLDLVSGAMVYGDKKNYLTALLTLDLEETEKLARKLGLEYGSFEELTKRPEIHRAVEEGINQVNSKLARFETIKKFNILPRDFSQEEGEITPTLKVKRKVVIEKYRDLLESLYQDDAGGRK